MTVRTNVVNAVLALLLVVFLATLSARSYAQTWGGQVYGKITRIDVTDAENYGLRVVLGGGGAPMCTGGNNWAYLNASDANYKAYVALLMLAKSMDRGVVISSNLVAGQCKIGYVSMTD